MPAKPHHHVHLPGGAMLLIEASDTVASAAIDVLIPSGSAGDLHDGHAAMLCEYLFRGAGDLDSRSHSDALDRLGVQRHASVGTHHLRLTTTMLGRRMNDALPLLIDMIRRPRMPEGEIDAVRSLCLQSLHGLEDDPQHLVMLHVREHHLPPPFNRTGYGLEDVISAATIDDLRGSWSARCRPSGTIISVAGAVDVNELTARFSGALDGWSGEVDEPVATGEAPRGAHHVEHDSAQSHLAMAWDAPTARDEHSMLERLSVHVLGGSSSGRLFTEVRQKRSLCYSVGASYRAGRDRGRVTFYAGTTPERAQETLDVSLHEIRRLQAGVTDDEFRRAVVGLKSSLVMAGESTPARAAALASDWFRFGQTRTLADVAAEVDAITHDQLNAYLGQRDIGAITMVDLGPAPLSITAAV